LIHEVVRGADDLAEVVDRVGDAVDVDAGRQLEFVHAAAVPECRVAHEIRVRPAADDHARVIDVLHLHRGRVGHVDEVEVIERRRTGHAVGAGKGQRKGQDGAAGRTAEAERNDRHGGRPWSMGRRADTPSGSGHCRCPHSRRRALCTLVEIV